MVDKAKYHLYIYIYTNIYIAFLPMDKNILTLTTILEQKYIRRQLIIKNVKQLQRKLAGFWDILSIIHITIFQGLRQNVHLLHFLKNYVILDVLSICRSPTDLKIFLFYICALNEKL